MTKLLNALKELNFEELDNLVREMNQWDGSMENIYYYMMGELEEVTHGMDKMELLRASQYGDFNVWDDYFTFNGYGNLDSLDSYSYEEQLTDYIEEIAKNAQRLHDRGAIDLNDYIDMDELEEEVEKRNAKIGVESWTI